MGFAEGHVAHDDVSARDGVLFGPEWSTSSAD
jgi:hypothetical protein